MSTIFVCCITENLIKIISAQLKNDSLSTSVVICAYSESIEGTEKCIIFPVNVMEAVLSRFLSFLSITEMKSTEAIVSARFW